MNWFKRKKDPTIAETLSLTAEQVVSAAVPVEEKLLERIAADLQQRLKNDLSSIIGEIVDTAVDNTRIEMEQKLRAELLGTLESRLDQLVEQGLRTHLTKPQNLNLDSNTE